MLILYASFIAEPVPAVQSAELLQEREQKRFRARWEGGSPLPKLEPQNSQLFSMVMPQLWGVTVFYDKALSRHHAKA